MRPYRVRLRRRRPRGWTPPRWRPLPCLAAVLTIVLAVTLGPPGDTHSTYTQSRTTGTSASTPPLVPVGLATVRTAAPQDVTVTGLAPGATYDRLVNIRNDGTPTVPAIDLAVTTTTATALDTNAANGLTVQVDLCSVVWQQTTAGTPATCAGSTTVLLAATPLVTAAAATPARFTTGLAALASLGVDHLRIRFGLPAGAPAGYTALTSVPRLSVWGVTTPDTPAPTADPGDEQLTVTWPAPTDGGSPITAYTVTLSTGAVCTTATTSCVFTGLTNGLTYTATMTATNSFGTSAASAAVGDIPYPAFLAPAAGRNEVWLDASRAGQLLTPGGTAAAGGDKVRTWLDRSGNGRDVAQPTAANQMTVGTINGHPAMDSVNTNWYISAANATFRDVIAVAMPSQALTNLQLETILAAPANQNGTSMRLSRARLGSSSGQLVNGNDWAYGGGSWTNSIYPTIPGPTPNGAGIYVGERATSITTNFSISTTYVGGGYIRGMVGPIGEVIVLNTTMTAAERREAEEYLARKWSVPIAPDAPTGLTVTPGFAQATVSWTAPTGWNGGSAITGYTAFATPTDTTLPTITCTTATTGCTLTGLTNGAPYTVTVGANNAVGTGTSPPGVEAVSYPSFFTAANLGGWFDGSWTPSVLAAGGTTATSGQKVATWQDRSGNGRHVTQATAGNQPTVGTLGTRQAVLSTATTWLTASSATGDFRTIVSVGTPATGPYNTMFAAPANLDFSQRLVNNYLPTAGTGSPVNVNDWSIGGNSWTNSVNLSGATPSPGVFVSESATTVNNSTFSISTSFNSRGFIGPLGEVAAFNRVLTANERRQAEEYLARKWSVAITPQAPTVTAVTKPASGQLTVTWTAPAWNGGSAVTGYTVTATAGKTCTAAAGATSCTVTGLTAGSTYGVTMTAGNAIGVGVTSAAMNGTA